LAKELTGRGAKVFIIRLPMGPQGEKQGLDDFLVNSGPEAFASLPRTPFKAGASQKAKEKKKQEQEQAKEFVSTCANNYDKSAIIKYLALANAEKFYPQLYIEVIRQYYKLIFCAEDFYEYLNGVYIKREIKVIESYVKELFGQNPRRSKIDEIVKLLAIDCHVETKELFKNSLKKRNLKNGILDLETLTLEPHSPDFISINQLPVNYNSKATCPLWKKTLKTCLPEDPSIRNLLQEWFGYCLTDETKHEKALFFVGDGANGKGTVGDTLLAMLGRDNCSSVHLADLERPAQRAILFGKLLNFASEISAKEVVKDSYFKSIVSGDQIMGEPKYKAPFNFRPHCKLMFATNSLPRVDDRSYAFFRRLIIIPFNQRFEDSKESGRQKKDKALRVKLLKELDGIFLWSLEGLRRLEKRGFFIEPEVISEKVEEYRRQNNPIIQFFEECCELKDWQIEVKDAYKTYVEWALQSGFQTMNDVNFSKSLRKEYPQIVGIKTAGTRIFKGVMLSKAGKILLEKALKREAKRFV
jgi:putative DNA primase/helicase